MSILTQPPTFSRRTAQTATGTGSGTGHDVIHQVGEGCTVQLHGGPLVCVARGPHRGHVFEAGSGTWVDDRHRDGGHG